MHFDRAQPIRVMVRQLLGAEPERKICGEAADGKQAVEQAELLNPDLVILDIHRLIMNGNEAARQMLQHSPLTLILILTTDSSPHFAQTEELYGVRGFLSKARATDHFATTGTTLLRNESYFPAYS
jgi:DNA-binding NarL/FixJ family response regulator